MQLIITIIFSVVMPSLLMATTAAHQTELDSLKPKKRESATKKKNTPPSIVPSMISVSQSEYEPCGEDLADIDGYYLLKRFKVRMGKPTDSVKYTPVKGDPDAECAIFVTSKVDKTVLGRLAGFCNTLGYANEKEEDKNNGYTYLSGATLNTQTPGKKKEYDENFYYRMVGNTPMKAACKSQKHSKKTDPVERISIQTQDGHCNNSIFGVPKAPEQHVKVEESKQKNDVSLPALSAEEAKPW